MRGELGERSVPSRDENGQSKPNVIPDLDHVDRCISYSKNGRTAEIGDCERETRDAQRRSSHSVTVSPLSSAADSA